MTTKSKDRTTKRGALVRDVKRNEGLSWQDIADEMRLATPSSVFRVIDSDRPQDASLVLIRDFLLRHGIPIDLADLAG